VAGSLPPPFIKENFSFFHSFFIQRNFPCLFLMDPIDRDSPPSFLIGLFSSSPCQYVWSSPPFPRLVSFFSSPLGAFFQPTRIFFSPPFLVRKGKNPPLSDKPDHFGGVKLPSEDCRHVTFSLFVKLEGFLLFSPPPFYGEKYTSVIPFPPPKFSGRPSPFAPPFPPVTCFSSPSYRERLVNSFVPPRFFFAPSEKK